MTTDLSESVVGSGSKYILSAAQYSEMRRVASPFTVRNQYILLEIKN